MIGCWDACLETDNSRIKIGRKTTKESTKVLQDTRYFLQESGLYESNTQLLKKLRKFSTLFSKLKKVYKCTCT